jgi:hypothetical protein
MAKRKIPKPPVPKKVALSKVTLEALIQHHVEDVQEGIEEGTPGGIDYARRGMKDIEEILKKAQKKYGWKFVRKIWKKYQNIFGYLAWNTFGPKGGGDWMYPKIFKYHEGPILP